MHITRRAACVAVVIGSVVAAGCGSSSKSSSTTAATASTAVATTAAAATTAAGSTAGSAATGSTAAASTTPVSLDLPASIKIGAPLDTSGSAAVATVGTDEKAGMQMAIDEINSNGFLGTTKLDPEFVDTQAAKDVATQTVIKMTTSDKVDAIIGFSLTPSFQAAGPTAQAAKIPTIAVGLSGTGVTEVGDYVFRVYGPLVNLFDVTDPPVIAALKPKTAAYFYSTDSSNVVEQNDHRRKIMEAAGVKTVANVGTASDAIDYSPQLTQIKAANPDVLEVNINGGQNATFLAQFAQSGIKTQLLGGISWGDPLLLANPTLQCGIYATTWDASSTAGTNVDFVKNYTAKTGKVPSPYAAWGYDAVYLYATAVRNAGTIDHAKVRDALAATKDFSGALGVYGFDANRLPVQTGVILQVDGGKAVPWTAGKTCTPTP